MTPLNRLIVTGSLVLATATSSVLHAQDRRPGTTQQPLLTAALAHASQAQPAEERTRMAPRYKWTAFGLLLAGGVITLTGLLAAEDVCYDSYSIYEEDCAAFKAGWIGTGVALAGAGAIVAAVGTGKREPVTNNVVRMTRRSLAWRVRF